jgi:hypothetical protein
MIKMSKACLFTLILCTSTRLCPSAGPLDPKTGCDKEKQEESDNKKVPIVALHETLEKSIKKCKVSWEEYKAKRKKINTGEKDTKEKGESQIKSAMDVRKNCSEALIAFKIECAKISRLDIHFSLDVQHSVLDPIKRQFMRKLNTLNEESEVFFKEVLPHAQNINSYAKMFPKEWQEIIDILAPK